MPRERGYIIAAMAFLAISASFLIGGYEFIRSSAISLFLDTFGAGYLPYGLAAMTLALVPCVYLYSILLSKIGGMRTLALTSLFSFACLITLYFCILAKSKTAVFLLYIFHQIYILILVEQYWSLTNSTLSSMEAKKYNGAIAGVAYIGPTVAGYVLYKYAQAVGTELMVLLAALSILPAVVLSLTAYKLAGEPQPSAGEKHGHKGHLHLSLIKTTPALCIIMSAVALAQVLSTVLEFNFSRMLGAKLPIMDERTSYLGGLWCIINGAAFVMQFIISPIVLKIFSVRTVCMIIPVINLVSQCVCLFFPAMPVATASFGIFKCLDYSLFRTSKEILYIPLSYDARYRVKQVVDAFTNRFSKGASAFVFSGLYAAGVSISASVYPMIGVVASAIWLKAASLLRKD